MNRPRLIAITESWFMSTAKEEVRQILEVIPDDATLEDIQYHIYVRQ